MSTWKPIPGYEGLYEISDAGEVRSLDRVVARLTPTGNAGTRHYFAKTKTIYSDRDGYSCVSLCKGGVQKPYRVSRLVLTAFEQPSKPGEEACHKNHDKLDNSIRNLRWGTRQENEDDKTSSGRRPRNTINKLTASDVALAKKLRLDGLTYKEIGKVLSCHLSNVWLIVKGATWQQT